MEDYCKAIEEAKLPERPVSGARDGCCYDEKRFREFVNSNMDIRDMSQHMADFTQSGDVAAALHAIRTSLQLGLQQRLDCAGSLCQIGSFYDGSQTGRLNEMDCLYVVSEADVVVQQASSCKGQFRVYLKGIECKPRDMNEKLIAVMKETLSEMTLPDGWTHGGYGSPDFSGPRCNGPSVTALFCNKDEKHISLDVSVAFSLTSQLQQRADFPPELRDSCRFLADSIKKIQSELSRTQISADLHLIGNLAGDTWHPTTALAEAEILLRLRPECSVKRALGICKVIVSIIQKWYEKHNTHTERSEKEYDYSMSAKRIQISAGHVRESILADLQNYAEGACTKTENRMNLNAAMAYQHIYLSSEDRNRFCEVLKSDASMNNAAIKHIILKNALQLKGAFSETNKHIEQQLVRSVFEELSSTDSFYTKHALIQECTINKFSFSMHLSHIKESVASDFVQQCEIILDNALAKVNIHLYIMVCIF